MTHPKAAPHVWPYPNHRNMAQVLADEANAKEARQARIAAQFGKEAV